MKRLCGALVLLMLISACSSSPSGNDSIDWQGHRGARGQAPENTVEGLRKALQEGVNTLHLETVITADSAVVLSHWPYIDTMICEAAKGAHLPTSAAERSIFKKEYQELQSYDCGSKQHPDFPGQENYQTRIPRLFEALAEAEEHAILIDRDPPHYTIELRSAAEWEGVFQPGVETFCDLVINELERARLKGRVTLASSDTRVLQYLHQHHPQKKLAFKEPVKGIRGFSEALETLGFVPEEYHCTADDFNIKAARDLKVQDVKLVVGPVNEIARAEKLIEKGVDAILTDYPGRLIPVLGS